MVLSAGYAPNWEFESDEIAAILACLKAIQGRCTTVRAEDFIISKRPRLGSITKHRKIEFTDYERRLSSMQSILQAVQQAYLGTGPRPTISRFRRVISPNPRPLPTAKSATARRPAPCVLFLSSSPTTRATARTKATASAERRQGAPA